MSPSDPDAPRTLDRRAFLVGIAAAGLGACTKGGVDAAAAPASAAGGVTGPATAAGGVTAQPVTTAPAATVPVATVPVTTAPGAPAATVTTVGRPAPTATTTPVPRGPAAFVRHGDRSRNEVALTFHTNGDPALVTRLAGALAAASVPATMFVIGEWADAQPALMRRLVADGHELANHTWSHPALADLSRAAMVEEIVRCRETLAAFAAGPVTYFRPSAIEVPTDAILAAAGTAGYAVSLGYDVDPLDYTDQGPAAIVEATAAAVDRGSIVSLHTGHADTITALPDLLALLRGRGLRPVTCSTLLR